MESAPQIAELLKVLYKQVIIRNPNITYCLRTYKRKSKHGAINNLLVLSNFYQEIIIRSPKKIGSLGSRWGIESDSHGR